MDDPRLLPPRSKYQADPAQVRKIQRILGLTETGILCRHTIKCAAIHTRSPQRGPGLIPLVLARHEMDR